MLYLDTYCIICPPDANFDFGLSLILSPISLGLNSGLPSTLLFIPFSLGVFTLSFESQRAFLLIGVVGLISKVRNYLYSYRKLTN